MSQIADQAKVIIDANGFTDSKYLLFLPYKTVLTF